MIDPLTGQPFTDNRFPSIAHRSRGAGAPGLHSRSPIFLGDTQNFHYVTANSSNSNDVNLRVTHIFGAQPQRGAGGGRGRGGFAPWCRAAAAPRRPGRVPGAFGRGGRGPQPTRSVLNASVGYRQSSSLELVDVSDDRRSAGATGLNVPVSWMLSKGRINNVLTVTYNRNSSTSTNLYAYNTDIVGAAGIDGVSSDPFDWGIPSLSFTTVADLRDRTPSRRVDQRIQISNSTMRIRGGGTRSAGAASSAICGSTACRTATRAAASCSPGCTPRRSRTAVPCRARASISRTSCSAMRSRHRSSTGRAT